MRQVWAYLTDMDMTGDGQTEAYLRDTGMTGLTSAWAMARRRPKEYWRKVDAAKRRSGVCPQT